MKVYVGRSADGRKRYVERTVHGGRREAERELARLVVEVDEGRHVAAAPMTVGELVDRWLEIKASTVEANTDAGTNIATCPECRHHAGEHYTAWSRIRRHSPSASSARSNV